jgi:hypothetical protein
MLCMALLLLSLASEAWASMPQHLSVSFKPKQEWSRSSQQALCSSLAKHLRTLQGPYALGVFSKVSCPFQSTPRASGPPRWHLKWIKSEQGTTLELALIAGNKTTQEALLKLPVFESESQMVEALSTPEASWLLALGILDALPVVGVMNPKWSPQGSTLVPPEDPLASNLVSRPSLSLVAVQIQFNAARRIWTVTESSTSVSGAGSPQGAPIWLANLEGRSSNKDLVEESLASHLRRWLTLRQEQQKQAEAAAQNLAAEQAAQKAEDERRAARLPMRPGDLWLTARFSPELSSDLMEDGYSLDAAFGWSRWFLSWLRLSVAHESTGYSASNVSEDNGTVTTATLRLTETSFGFGVHHRFSLTPRISLYGHTDVLWRAQTIDVDGKISDEFEFEKLEESDLVAIDTGATLGYLTQTWLLSAAARFVTLVPYTSQYQHVSGQAAAEHLLYGFRNNDTTRLRIRIGPLLRIEMKAVNRTFPAKDQGEVDAASTKVGLLTSQFGVISHVSF